MRAGRRDTQITLQNRTVVQNSYGEEIETWVDLVTLWAERRVKAAQERFAARQERAEQTEIFAILFREDVRRQDRLICNGVVYDIEAVLPIGRREGLEITATAKVL